MALPRSTDTDIQNRGNDDFQQGANRIELANIYDSLEDRGDDVHPYYNTVRSGLATTNTGTNNVDSTGHPNDSANVGRSKVKIELSCKAICLGVTGILLCCTLICAISGFIVYHVINAKMAESGTQTSQGQDMSSSTNITDALAMDINSLKDEVNKLSNNQSESRDHQIDNNRRLQTLNETLLEVQDQQKSSGRQVAFTVTSPTGTLVNYAPIFREIVLNEGDAYNTSTGRFTCPIQGVYLFTLVTALYVTRPYM